MVLAAPEFVIAERIELLDQVEVAAELQHRMLADRVMRGEKGSKFQALHRCFLGCCLFCKSIGKPPETMFQRASRRSGNAVRRPPGGICRGLAVCCGSGKGQL